VNTATLIFVIEIFMLWHYNELHFIHEKPIKTMVKFTSTDSALILILADQCQFNPGVKAGFKLRLFIIGTVAKHIITVTH